MIDRNDPDCDCKDDCDVVHIFTTMEKKEFINDDKSVNKHQQWFDMGDATRPPSGTLANYLLDPADIFSNRLIKNLTKLSHHLEHDVDLAQKRFDEASFSLIINFVFCSCLRPFCKVDLLAV